MQEIRLYFVNSLNNMNIFEKLRDNYLSANDILCYKGLFMESMYSYSTDGYHIAPFGERLEVISQIVKAAIFTSAARDENKSSMDVVRDLCNNDIELSNSIYGILESAVQLDKVVNKYYS